MKGAEGVRTFECRPPTEFKGSIDDARELAAEVQATAKRMHLRPSMRTHYLRTAFQKTGDASVRISLDTVSTT